MTKQMHVHKTMLGLAAPQIGHQLRIIGFRGLKSFKYGEISSKLGYDYFPTTFLINPKLEPIGEEKVLSIESCYSLNTRNNLQILRYRKIRVTGITPDGKKFDQCFTDGLSFVLQHEIDHLDGILIEKSGQKFLFLGIFSTICAGILLYTITF